MNKKVFDKIAAGLNEAAAIARGDPDAIMAARVTPSCGCAFCDLDIPADSMGVHRANGHEVQCTRSENIPICGK